MMDKCKVEEETLNGVNGFRVTGPNGNSIFFPLSGFHQIDKLYQNLLIQVSKKGQILIIMIV